MFVRRRTGWEIPRLILLLVTTTVGWVIIGLGLLSGGLVWGLNSHQVSYIHGGTGDGSRHYFLSDDNGFLIFRQDATNSYYIIHIPDYTPFVDTATILSDLETSTNLSFIASTDSVNVSGHIIGTDTMIPTAHPIEQVVFYDTRLQRTLTYTKSDYTGNLNGYAINNWPYASLLMLAGALSIGGGIFFSTRGKQRRKLAAAAERARLEALPSPFARELGQTSSPSTQAYHGIEQYPRSNSQ